MSPTLEEALHRSLRVFPNVKVHCPTVFDAVEKSFYVSRESINPYTYVQNVWRGCESLVRERGDHQHCVEGFYYFSRDPATKGVLPPPKPMVRMCQTRRCAAAFTAPTPAELATGRCSSCDEMLPAATADQDDPARGDLSGLATLFAKRERHASRFVAAVFAYAYPDKVVSVRDGSHDRNIDVAMALTSDPYRTTDIVQVKWQLHPVQPGEVWKLIGTVPSGLVADRLTRMLVSRSGFTKAALAEAASAGIYCLTARQILGMTGGIVFDSPLKVNAYVAGANLFADRVGPL